MLRHLTVSMLLVLSIMFASGCGDDVTEAGRDGEAAKTRTSGAEGPAATGARVGNQVFDVKVSGGRLEPASIEAQAGAVTIRLRNVSDRPLRIALREGKQLLTEGGPASRKQLSEITVPVEAGKTYEYFTPGQGKAELSGKLVVSK